MRVLKIFSFGELTFEKHFTISKELCEQFFRKY